jgi:hypothetical protein
MNSVTWLEMGNVAGKETYAVMFHFIDETSDSIEFKSIHTADFYFQFLTEAIRDCEENHKSWINSDELVLMAQKETQNMRYPS